MSAVEWKEKAKKKKSHKAGGKMIVPAGGEYFCAVGGTAHTIKDS